MAQPSAREAGCAGVQQQAVYVALVLRRGRAREGQRRQVVQDTRNLHRAVNTDVEQVQARRQAIISNQSSLEATEIGYQVGTRNIVDVLNAQRQLYAAVRDYKIGRAHV